MSSKHDYIRLRRGTSHEWSASQPQPGGEVLRLGEPGFEKDTYKLKIGDGVTPWNSLPYISGGFGGNDGPLEYEYDVTMSSNDSVIPSELYFNSLCNNIDFSSYFDDLINNQYTVNLKVTSVNDSNKFLIASCDNITKNSQFGDIDAFWPSRSIKWIIDGGDDQYDSANYINTNYTYLGIPTGSPSSTTLRNISIPYNGGRIAEQSQYWGSNDYVTLYKKSIWAMVAKGNTPTMPNVVFYGGNTGADGNGDKDNGTLTNYNGYQAGYARLYGNDPTYTKLIITKTGTTPSYFIDSDNDTNDDLFGASGISSDTIAVVVFYGSDNVNPSSLSDLQILFENFVDNVLSGSVVSQIKDNFYNNFNTLYGSVDPGFWYENFEFFTGTNNGSANTINAEDGSGSGAVFEVTVDQETNKYTIATSVVGINYVVGDIIKIPGSGLGSPEGISPDEDIYVRVDTIDINGGIDTFSTITSNEYRFINLTRLAESDGFRFFDNEKFYLNIDIAGLGLGVIDTQIQDAFNTSLVAGDGINLDYDGGNQTLTIESTANTKILPGDNVIFNYNSGTDELTISANSITVPSLEDILVEGDGIDLTFDEENNTVTISQESIANYTDNRLLTSDGTTTGINAESNLTFDGSVLDINGDITFGSGSSPTAIFSSRNDQPINILAGDAGASINIDSVTDSNIELLTTGSGRVNIANQWYLPNTDGTSNQVLTTDGAGNSSWVDNFALEARSLTTTVFNKTGSPIPKFNVVYINGGQGDMPTITLAIASGEATSSKTYGITAENIDNMSSGKVIVEGALTGLDTDQYNPTAPVGDVNGSILYLSPTVAGAATTTKPSAPNHLVSVGTIVRTHQNEGVVEVRIQNGFELQELHNVAISGVTDNQYLQYDSDTSLWIPTSSGVFSILSVDNLTLDGNTISSTDTNGNIILQPSGSGDVQINADTLRVGDSNVDATIITNGTGNLKLSGDNSSGNIIIETNGNVNINPGGSGATYIGSSSLLMKNGTSTIATDNNTSDLILGTNKDTSSANIRIYSGAGGGIAVSGSGNFDFNCGGNIYLSPETTVGNVYINNTVSGGQGIAVKTAPPTGASPIFNIVQLSQATYDGLGSYDSNTLYVIT